MTCIERRGGITIEERRLSGPTPTQALQDLWEQKYSRIKKIPFLRHALPNIRTLDLHFERIGIPMISTDKKHFLCVGYDENRASLIKDDRILLSEESGHIQVTAASYDFSRLAVFSKDQRGLNSLHLIDPAGQITTPLEDKQRINLVKKTGTLSKMLVVTQEDDVLQGLYYFESLDTPTTICIAPSIRVLPPPLGADFWPTELLAAARLENCTKLFHYVQGIPQAEIKVPTVHDPNTIRVLDCNSYIDRILWSAESDKKHCVYLNDQLLAEGEGSFFTKVSEDFSQVLVFTKPDRESESSQIVHNGKIIWSGPLPIIRYGINDKVTFAAFSLKNKDSVTLQFLTPNGNGHIPGLESVESLEAAENHITANVRRNGHDRQITIKLEPTSQTTQITESPL